MQRGESQTVSGKEQEKHAHPKEREAMRAEAMGSAVVWVNEGASVVWSEATDEATEKVLSGINRHRPEQK